MPADVRADAATPDRAQRPPRRIAVLASGGGSNLAALFAHFDHGDAAAVGRIVAVASNRADAGALARAAARGVATTHLADPADGVALCAWLAAQAADVVVLAGYLKLLPAEVVRAFPGRVLNVHPALLPAFGGTGMYGQRVHAAVVASGARITGVTIHFVDEHYDRGAILAQWPVPVFPHDTPADVAARVLRVEHQLLPRAVQALCAGAVALDAEGRSTGVVPFAPADTPPDDTFVLSSALR
jgi:formyltetrahydrofolate-dependent phosphoribosylglycinamide formyltransferase